MTTMRQLLRAEIEDLRLKLVLILALVVAVFPTTVLLVLLGLRADAITASAFAVSGFVGGAWISVRMLRQLVADHVAAKAELALPESTERIVYVPVPVPRLLWDAVRSKDGGDQLDLPLAPRRRVSA